MSDGNGQAGKWPTTESPPGWAWAKFAQVFDNVTSSELKLKQKEYAEEGSLPVVDQGQELIGGYTNNDELQHRSKLPVVLFGDHTQCVKYLDFQFVQGADGTKILKPSECVEPRFAYWSMRTIELPKKGYSRHFKFLRDSEFPIPPLAEQRRIVTAIESLQARSSRAREALSEVGPLLEQFRQSVLRSAFSGRLTADWRAAHPDVEPASELLARIRTERRQRWEQAEQAKYKAKGKKPPKGWKEKYKKPSDRLTERRLTPLLESAPNTWTIANLETIGELITGKTPSTRNESFWNGDIPFVTPSQVHPNGHILPPKRTVTTEGAEQARIIHANTILIVCIGTVGKAGLLDRTAIFNQQLNAIVACPQVEPRLLFFWCKLLRSWLIEEASATVNSAIINKTRLGYAPFPLPPVDEQREMLRLIDAAFNGGEAIEQKSAESESALTQLDQSILAKAFRGELVPQDPNDEPASELLARIRAANESQPKNKTTNKRGKRNGD
ncbi:restriction endonuclease subunit S [Stieleria sp. ICT_E10.1]|uniref:restriction endonuclease subunit S n=1 Tax=Stieleria sedimenti TaxID=2976331 RepID=UPI00218022AF|nr:restriction endonuclease subunit S [Stieleria sedimenti]MCS7469560.1 restriction endonuclease subunit S [Stieleria sedimenti]